MKKEMTRNWNDEEAIGRASLDELTEALIVAIEGGYLTTTESIRHAVTETVNKARSDGYSNGVDDGPSIVLE